MEAKPSQASNDSAQSRGMAERRFYSRMAIAIGLIVFIGFAPSFFLKPLGVVHYPRPNPELSVTLLLHGIVFSLWIALFIVQTQLVAAGRRDVHRALGLAGFVLASAIIPIMYFAVVDQVGRGTGTPFTDVMTWTIVPLATIPAYAALLWLSWRAVGRGDFQAHKRFMLGLMILLTQPAIGRWPVAPPTLPGFFALTLLSFALFIPLVLWDRRFMARVHVATTTGLAVYATLIAVQFSFLAEAQIWPEFAAQLPAIG